MATSVDRQLRPSPVREYHGAMGRHFGLPSLGLLLLTAVGCNDPNAINEHELGSYAVTVTTSGKSDDDLLTVSKGTQGTLLLSFAYGITTDADGPNPLGLRASIKDQALTLESQPVNIDYSTGPADGLLDGEGTLAPDGNAISLTLHFVENTATATIVDYVVSGSKQ